MLKIKAVPAGIDWNPNGYDLENMEEINLLREAVKAIELLTTCHSLYTGEPGHDSHVWFEAEAKAMEVLDKIKTALPK